MHCLENSIIGFDNTFYKQQHGIVTEENNSVTIANISLHFIIKQIKEIKKTVIFRRYIDDIIYIAKTEEISLLVRKQLLHTFETFSLKLEFRSICTKENNSNIEFLDVEHQTDKNAKRGFLVKDFVKPTAREIEPF